MEHLETLPSAQKNIASYMLSNKEKSIFMTAAELGYNAGSSEASAIRLASTLGYANFPDFIKSLQLEAQSQLSTIGRLQLHKLLPDEGGYVAGVIARDLELAKYYLKANGDNDKALKLLAAEICEAGAVYLIGLRSTRCLVQYMEYYLSWFFPKIFIPSYENLGNYLTAAPKNSLTLGISFPRYTRQTGMHRLHKKQRIQNGGDNRFHEQPSRTRGRYGRHCAMLAHRTYRFIIDTNRAYKRPAHTGGGIYGSHSPSPSGRAGGDLGKERYLLLTVNQSQ